VKLAIDWEKPTPLRSGRREGLIYTLDWEALPMSAGIYIFARRWGGSYEALYVGKSQNVRRRIRGHLNNLRLMRHIEDAKTGRRVVIAGSAIIKPGQKKGKVLSLLERTFIRHFLSEGHDLVNQQGVRIRRHEILCDGGIPRSFVPSVMYLERAKGE